MYTSDESTPLRRQHNTLIAGVIALLLMAAMIAFGPEKLCFDEPYHLSVAKKAVETTWREALVDPKSQSAAGPLYAAVHVAVHPLTNFNAPGVRWVNFGFLLLTILVVSSSLGTINQFQWRAGLSLLSVPFLWPCVGMALTEVPALFAFSLYLYCFLTLIRKTRDTPHHVDWSLYIWSIAAGIALGVAILGRQTYLIVLPSVFVLVLSRPRFWIFAVITVFSTFVVCIWPFLLWKGLVPPSQQHTNSGLRLQNLMLSLTYITAATIFIHPRWIRFRDRSFVVIALVLGFVLTWFSRDYDTPPAKTLLIKIFGERLGLLSGFIAGSALGALSVLWFIETAKQAWRERSDIGRLFLYAILLALVVAPLKVSHLFSSRYVVGALGTLILVLLPPQREPLENTRFWFGGILGCLMLSTYY